MLHEQVLTEEIDGKSLFLCEQLRFLDRFLMQQFEKVSPTGHPRLPWGETKLPYSQGLLIVGYNDSDDNPYHDFAGLRTLRFSWDNNQWGFGISSFHQAGYHRIHAVTICHQEAEVLFDYPIKYKDRVIPNGVLPTDITVKLSEPELTAK